MRMHMLFRYLWTIFVTILVGCSVGPKYEPPALDIPGNWHSNTTDQMKQDSPDCFRWWEALNDPLLNALLTQASISNLDLSIAATRILEARREEKGASGALYPHIDGSASYGHARYNQNLLNDVLGTHSSKKQRNIDLFEAGFDAEWEIDLFGKNAHDLCALKAKTAASEEEYLTIWVSLSAEIAKNYIELRGYQTSLDLLNKNIVSQKETLQLTQDLTTAGFASSVDPLQASAELNSLIVKKPDLQLSIDKTIHRLSILLGFPPGDLYDELIKPRCPPTLPDQLPIGIPSELLRRRPDIRKAECDLAAATEQVGSAIAALFPRISLRGFIGDISTLSAGSYTWYAGPQILLPIFNSKLLEKDVDLSKIKTQQALYSYQKTVLEALEETENAIASFHYALDKNRLLADSLKTSKEVYDTTLQLYQKGFEGYLQVLVNDRSYLQNEETYNQSQVELLIYYISLYKALGGGWELRDCCLSE